MKTIELLNKKYTYPTKWEEITLEQYQKIDVLIKEFKEDDNEIQKVLEKIRMISAYTNIPFDVLKQVKPPHKVLDLIKDLTYLDNEIPSKQINEFVFKGVKYYVINSLMEVQFQDYVSLENVLQREDFVGNMHYIMAVMCRKSLDETIDDYDIEERAKLFLGLDMVTINNVAVFFYTLEKISLITSHIYSNPKEVVEMKIAEVEKSFSRKLDGVGWLTRLRIGIIRLWFRYFVKDVMKSYIFTAAKSSTIKSKQRRWKKLIEKIKNKYKKIWSFMKK